MLENVRSLLEENEPIIVAAGITMLLIILLVQSGQLRAVNRRMAHMIRKIQEYMEAVMTEEETEEKEEREELIRYVQKELEREKNKDPGGRISQEDEKVFNEVIKEYFP